MHNSVAYGALLASSIKTTAQTTAMVRIAYAISFLDMLGYGFLSPITYSLLNKDVIGATGFGALQSVSNAAALLAGASLGRLSDTRGRKPAIVVSAGLSLFGYLLYVAGRVAADAAPLAACVLPCVAQVLTTVGRAGLIAPLNALLTDGQSDEEGRRLLGRLVGTFGLGYAIGSGSGGYLSQYDHALLLALAPHPPCEQLSGAAGMVRATFDTYALLAVRARGMLEATQSASTHLVSTHEVGSGTDDLL